MSSTFFTENLDASNNARVAQDLVLAKGGNNVTVDALTQTIGAGTAQIVDLAGTTDEIVFGQVAQNLGNKAIASNSTLVDASDATKVVAIDLSGSTASTSTTLAWNQTVDRNIAFPDADGILALAPSGGTPNAIVKINATGDGYDETSMISALGTDIVGVTDISNGAGADIQLGDLGQNVIVAGSVIIKEDLTVDGTTTTVNSENVLIEDNNLLLSANYTLPVGRQGGLAINYLPIASSLVSSVFTAPAGPDGGTVSATGLALSPGDIIAVSNAADPSNNGVFQVLTYADPVIAIDPVPTHNFLNSMFVASSGGPQGTITSVNMAVIQSGTDGIFEVASGSNAPAMSFVDLATVDSPGAWIEETVTAAAGPSTAILINPAVPFAANSCFTIEIVVNGQDVAGGRFGGKLNRSFEVDGANNVTANGSGSKDYSPNATAASSWNGGVISGIVDVVPAGNTVSIALNSQASTNDWKLIYRITRSL